MRYAEGPSIECHHIPIEQAHQPVPVFRHKCKLGTPLRLSLHDTADHVVLMSAKTPPLIGTQPNAVSFEPQATLGDPRVNSVQQAIREAAEKGGYRYRSWKVNDLEPNEGYNALQLRALPEHLHDPDFWKALATARKWEDVNAWRFHWHRFIDHLADGGDVESFFKAL